MPATAVNHTLQTPGQLLILTLDAAGLIRAFPDIPFRIYLGRTDDNVQHRREVGHILIWNQTGDDLEIAAREKLPAGGSAASSPFDPSPAARVAAGQKVPVTLALKENYRALLGVHRPNHWRYKVIYLLEVHRLGPTVLEQRVLEEIDPELIVEGRP